MNVFDDIELKDEVTSKAAEVKRPNSMRARQSSFASMKDRYRNFELKKVTNKIESEQEKVATKEFKTPTDADTKLTRFSKKMAKLEAKQLSLTDPASVNVVKYMSSRPIKLHASMMSNLTANTKGLYSIGKENIEKTFAREPVPKENINVQSAINKDEIRNIVDSKFADKGLTPSTEDLESVANNPRYVSPSEVKDVTRDGGHKIEKEDVITPISAKEVSEAVNVAFAPEPVAPKKVEKKEESGIDSKAIEDAVNKKIAELEVKPKEEKKTENVHDNVVVAPERKTTDLSFDFSEATPKDINTYIEKDTVTMADFDAIKKRIVTLTREKHEVNKEHESAQARAQKMAASVAKNTESLEERKKQYQERLNVLEKYANSLEKDNEKTRQETREFNEAATRDQKFAESQKSKENNYSMLIGEIDEIVNSDENSGVKTR